jgi:hypothetical protein
MLDSIVNYFDLSASFAGEGPTHALVWPQYLMAVIGVLIEPYLREYIATGKWTFSGFWGRTAFALIIGLMILPALYRSTFDPTKPEWVQVVALLPMAMGWRTLVDLGAKALGR